MRKMRILIIFLLLMTLLLSVAAADTAPPTLTVNVAANDGIVRVSGTVFDDSGVDRVEVKINDGGWRTANLIGSNFNYSEDITVTGQHVAHVRAFDIVGNPTPINITTFYAQKKSSSSIDDDISFYIRLTGVKLASMNVPGNIREMEYLQDFAVEFEINNDDSVPHKLRYKIEVNGYEEVVEDVSISAGRSRSVGEWFTAAPLNVGQNRIRISVIDWETKQTVTDRTMILNVTAAEKSVEFSGSDDVPEWLKEFAEVNGLVLPSKQPDVSQNSIELERKIFELERKISSLENVQRVPVEQKTDYSKFAWPMAFAVVVIAGLYMFSTGKLDRVLKRGEFKETEEDEVFKDN